MGAVDSGVVDSPFASPLPYSSDSAVAALKTPPYSLEAEAAVLGILLSDNTAFDSVQGVLAETEFYTREHQLIYKAAMALIAAQRVADAITVCEWLRERDELKNIHGGAQYVIDLSLSSASSVNARQYAELVHERAVMRALIQAAEKLCDLAWSAKGLTAAQVLDRAQNMLAEVDARSRRGQGTFRPISEALGDLMTQLDDKEAANGLPTGFTDLDKIMNPMQPGQLIVIGARPAVGKTSKALNIATHAALTLGAKVGFFSMEMSDIELAVRMLSGESGIPSGRFREHRLDDKCWERINGVLARVNSAQFYIDETGGLSIQELKARARVQSKRIGGFDLLVVDYVQLSRAEGRYDNRSVELGAVTSGLKQLAKELKCPVIALSQLNRDSAKGKSKPTISELRDSGAIESDADTILLLHREFVTSHNEEHIYDAEVIVGKQRNGAIGDVPLDYDPTLTRFFNRNESPGRRKREKQRYAGKGDAQ